MDIATGRCRTLELGNLSIARDWGWAPEFADAMARILDLEAPEDFVIATGETNTLEDFVAATFACFKLNWREHVVRNDMFLRPADIAYSSGDPSKAERLMGWKAKMKMRDIIQLLVEAETIRRNG